MIGLKRTLLAAAASAALSATLMPVSAAAGAQGSADPYFCGRSFTLFVMKGETVSSGKHAGVHVLTTSGRDYVFSEADFAVPDRARPVREDHGVKVYPVRRGSKLIGYLLDVDGAPTKVIVGSSSFEGSDRDMDVLGRFNFHANRPGGCRSVAR